MRFARCLLDRFTYRPALHQSIAVSEIYGPESEALDRLAERLREYAERVRLVMPA